MSGIMHGCVSEGPTFAAVSMAATVVAAERVHDVYRGRRGGELPAPQACVPRHGVPAVLLQPIQVQHRVSRVPGVLEIRFAFFSFSVRFSCNNYTF
jgi:hypothetical protein